MRTASSFHHICLINFQGTGCLKDIEPSDALTTGSLTATKERLCNRG